MIENENFSTDTQCWSLDVKLVSRLENVCISYMRVKHTFLYIFLQKTILEVFFKWYIHLLSIIIIQIIIERFFFKKTALGYLGLFNGQILLNGKALSKYNVLDFLKWIIKHGPVHFVNSVYENFISSTIRMFTCPSSM